MDEEILLGMDGTVGRMNFHGWFLLQRRLGRSWFTSARWFFANGFVGGSHLSQGSTRRGSAEGIEYKWKALLGRAGLQLGRVTGRNSTEADRQLISGRPL